MFLIDERKEEILRNIVKKYDSQGENRELKKECAELRFREDLFYRLSVFPLKVPPLRERPDDIVFLSMHFMKKFSGLAGKKINGFSEDSLELIKKKQWNGNVRELENAIQRAVFLCDGEIIKCEHFMFDDYEKTQMQAGSIKEMEKELIVQTLKEVGGNKTKAARKLGVSVRTIRNKLNEYKIMDKS